MRKDSEFPIHGSSVILFSTLFLAQSHVVTYLKNATRLVSLVAMVISHLTPNSLSGQLGCGPIRGQRLTRPNLISGYLKRELF